MQITKVINNNVVSAYDHKSGELVIMGRGIGFKKKPGDFVHQDLIDKKFRLENETQMQQFIDLMSDLPSAYLSLVSEIIQTVSPLLEGNFSNSLYITLMDHIHFAVERAREGIYLMNPLRWDIKQIYPKEYSAALTAVKLVEDTMKVSLEEDEAASIAIHFVNAEMNSEMPVAVKLTDLVQGIMDVVKEFYGERLNEDSVQFQRLIPHIRQFSQRIIAGLVNTEDKDELYDLLVERYQESHRCAERIRQFVEQQHKVSVSDEELTYLMVHLRRISS